MCTPALSRRSPFIGSFAYGSSHSSSNSFPDFRSPPCFPSSTTAALDSSTPPLPYHPHNASRIPNPPILLRNQDLAATHPSSLTYLLNPTTKPPHLRSLPQSPSILPTSPTNQSSTIYLPHQQRHPTKSTSISRTPIPTPLPLLTHRHLAEPIQRSRISRHARSPPIPLPPPLPPISYLELLFLENILSEE